MAETRLAARSALAGLGPRAYRGREGRPGLVVRERRDLVSLRVQRRHAQPPPPAQALGMAFPADPGHAALVGERRLICLRVDEWLLLGVDSQGRSGHAARALREALGPGLAVMDESHGRTTLVLEGPAAEAVLQKGIAVDLAREAFGEGRAMQAGLGGLAVLLLREAPERFVLQVARGFAVSLMDWLLATAAPEGVEVVVPDG